MLYLYITIIIILHIMPMGFVPTEKPLNKMELGPFRLDYLLHTLIFLPWMFVAFWDKRKKMQRNKPTDNLDYGPSALRSFSFSLLKTHRSSLGSPRPSALRSFSFSLLNTHGSSLGSPRPLALLLLLGIIFAASAEGIQYWLPYRGFNPMDVLFNVMGVLIGAGLLGVWLCMRRKLEASSVKLEASSVKLKAES